MSRTVSPNYFTIEGDGGSNPPARPTLDEVGGANFVDATAPGYAPIPDEQPLSADYNQLSLLAWAMSKMATAITIGVTGGSSPTLNSVVAMSRNISTLTSGNPDITVTHIGTGHYTVAIPAAKLPPMSTPPKAYANKAGAASASASWVSAGLIAVYTSDNSGLIEANFTLECSGY